MKRKILLLLFFSFFVLFFIPESSLACHLKKGTYYTDPACENPIEVYDWSWDLGGGCDEGISAGALYSKSWFGLLCTGPESKWKKYPGNDGEICKVRWGILCGGSFEGKYDASENKCVMCDGKRQIKGVKCGQQDDSTVKCESACGARPECDEIYPGTMEYERCTFNKITRVECDIECEYVTTEKVCDSALSCQAESCEGKTYYCTYDGFSWGWRTSKPTEVCTDGIDNDCDGAIDGADSDCATCVYRLTINPSTGSYEGMSYTWSIDVKDGSSPQCPESITYSIDYRRVGECDLLNTYANPTGFTISKGSSLTNVLSVKITRAGDSCTLILMVVGPNNYVVAKGVYRVSSTIAECLGSVSLTLTPSTVAQGEVVIPSATGLSNCREKIVFFKKDSCLGPTVDFCMITDGGCNGKGFTAPSIQGVHIYYACIDKNGDLDADDVGESDSRRLIVLPTYRKCEAVIYNGPSSEKIDVAFIGEFPGISKERTVLPHWEKIISFKPFSEHKDKFNVWLVKEAPNFECFKREIPLIWKYECNDEKVQRTVVRNCPADVIIAVKTLPEVSFYALPFYQPPIAYTGAMLPIPFVYSYLVTVHEFGHAFGKLWDEYSYGVSAYSYLASEPNCDIEFSGNEKIPCPKFRGFEDAGCYKECTFNDWYRSTKCSIMRTIEFPWCWYFNQVSIAQLEKCIRQRGCVRGKELQVSFQQTTQPIPIYFLTLHYKDGNLIVKNVSLDEGFVPDRSIQPLTGYSIESLSSKGEKLDFFNFDPPRGVFHDLFNETGNITGYLEIRDDFEFSVPITYSKDITFVNFYSPEKVKLSELDLSKFEKEGIAIAKEVCKVGKECKSLIIGTCTKVLNILYNKEGKPLPSVVSSWESEVKFIPISKGKIKHVGICFEPDIKVFTAEIDVN